MLSIDEAISHCLEVAEKQEDNAKDCNSFDEWTETEYYDKESCLQCAAEQRQLAEWLTELKDLREKNKVCDRLIKEEQIAEYKRLLKLAVEDINECVDCFKSCDECCCDQDNHCHWKHEAEALKLIGEDENVNT